MKRFRDIYILTLMMILLMGCNRSGDDALSSAADMSPLSSCIATRSDGGEWSSGESIGVVMISLDGSSAGINSGCFVATGTGSETTFVSDTPMSRLDDGASYIVAYYPYSTSVNLEKSLDIDVRDLEDDILVSEMQYSDYTEETTLSFDPLLSKIVFNINAATASDYDNFVNGSVSISGLTPCAEFDIELSAFTLGESEIITLQSSQSEAVSSVTRSEGMDIELSTSIIPQSSTDASVNFALADGSTYSISLDVATLSSGMVYTYSADVTSSGVELQSLTITPWGDGGLQSGIATVIPDGYIAIYDEDDFREYFSYDNNITVNLILMNDLDLDSDWEMSYGLYRDCVFDGNGHTITYGFSQNYDSYMNEFFDTPLCIHALFCINSGTIRNLTVAGDIDLTAEDYSECEMAGITEDNSGIIQNCVSKLSVTATKLKRFGGIAIKQDGSDRAIINCCNLGDINISNGFLAKEETNSDNYGIGGVLVYTFNDATLKNCYNAGDIVVTDEVGYYGGVVAYLNSADKSYVNYLFNSAKYSDLEAVGNSDVLGAAYFSDKIILNIDDEKMQSLAFVEILNNEAYNIAKEDGVEELKAWKMGESSYPEFDVLLSPYYTDLPAGLGTEEYPYIISTSQQLVDLSSEVAAGDDKEGVYYAVLNSIFLIGLSSDWVPIGTAETPFQGDFSSVSGNHEIITLNISGYSDRYNSLFGVIGAKGSVHDISIAGEITANYYCAGVASINYGSISSIYNYATICSHGTYSYIGGVVAVNIGGTVSDCVNEGAISESGTYVTIGTIVGVNSGGTVSQCSSTVGATVDGLKSIYNSTNNYIVGSER